MGVLFQCRGLGPWGEGMGRCDGYGAGVRSGMYGCGLTDPGGRRCRWRLMNACSGGNDM